MHIARFWEEIFEEETAEEVADQTFIFDTCLLVDREGCAISQQRFR